MIWSSGWTEPTLKMNYGLKRKEGVNTCMTWCAAKYFGLHPRKVPFFLGTKDCRRNFERYFYRRGKIIKCYYYNPKRLPKRGMYMVVGLSRGSKAKRRNRHDMRTKHHMVIHKHGKLFYDPNHHKTPLKGKPFYMWLITIRK